MPTKWDVIKAPVVTEKALRMKDQPADEGNQVLVFQVHLQANKTEVKLAVESIFKVKVDRVRVVRKHSKRVYRLGRKVGERGAWKKAYVTLKAGQRITEYSEVI